MSDEQPAAWPTALAPFTTALPRDVLDVWFPEPALGAAGRRHRPPTLDALRAATTRPRHPPADRAAPRSTSTPSPTDTADVYLRLHLLSHRLVRPHELT